MSNSLLRVACAVLCAGILTACAACFSQEQEPGDTEEVPQELAKEYRANLEERQSKINVLSENAVRVDDAIRALRNELAGEDRRGRVKDLRARIEQLAERKKALSERIEAERGALSQAGELEPDEAFYSVAAKDLAERQERRKSEIEVLDTRIAALQGQLERRGGTRVRRENLGKQIEELSRRRDELAARQIAVEDIADLSAIEAELARTYSERAAGRQKELAMVRSRIEELETTLAGENRRVRRKTIEAQIEELKQREHQLDIEPPGPRYGKAETVGEHREVIGRGLGERQVEQKRRSEVLDQKLGGLRQKLRTENRSARRKSIILQIRELEQQKRVLVKPEADFEPPPTKGFDGAPYAGTSDLDYEYKPPATSD